jgi:hypothetical protein
VSRAIGSDIFEPAGDRLVVLALIDIYSHELLDAPTAAAAGVGFEEPADHDGRTES